MIIEILSLLIVHELETFQAHFVLSLLENNFINDAQYNYSDYKHPCF